MRKVIAVELVSVDGVMRSPEEWAFSYSNDEMEEANASGSVPVVTGVPVGDEGKDWARAARP